MVYNKQISDDAYITIINILGDELINLRRAAHEFVLSEWYIKYIDKYMENRISKELKAEYVYMYWEKKHIYSMEKENLTFILESRLNGKLTHWEFDMNKMILILTSNEKIEVPLSYLDRPVKLRSEQYQEAIYQLYGTNNSKDSCAQIKNGQKVPIRTCTMQITEDCNLRCTYCYQINKKKNSIMPFETARKFIDMIMNANSDTPYLSSEHMIGVIWDFIGGEAFVEVELMDQICAYITEKMILSSHPWRFTTKFSTGSNGTLFTTEKIQNFFHKWSPMFAVAITLDGCKELHDKCRIFPDGSGSYDLALESIHLLQQGNPFVSSKLTVSPDNISMLSKAIINMIKEGYTDLHENPVFEEGWNIEHAKIYYRELKIIADYFLENNLYQKVDFIIWKENGIGKLPDSDYQNWCGGNGSMIAVNPKGNIYPCIRYMESSVGDDVEPFIIGDVENGLLYTTKQKKMTDELMSITRFSQSPQKCIDCPVNYGCAWCTAYNYQKFGTPNKRATYICWLHKAEVLANFYYWNKLRLLNPKSGSPFKNNLPEEDALQIISKEELDLLKRNYEGAVNQYECISSHSNK